MIRPLDEYTRLEHEQRFMGKMWAYTAVTGRGSKMELGIAEANEPGYTPVSAMHANADTYDEMSDHAVELNLARGMSVDEAMRIVASSMAQGKLGDVGATSDSAR